MSKTNYMVGFNASYSVPGTDMTYNMSNPSIQYLFLASTWKIRPERVVCKEMSYNMQGWLNTLTICQYVSYTFPGFKPTKYNLQTDIRYARIQDEIYQALKFNMTYPTCNIPDTDIQYVRPWSSSWWRSSSWRSPAWRARWSDSTSTSWKAGPQNIINLFLVNLHTYRGRSPSIFFSCNGPY